MNLELMTDNLNTLIVITGSIIGSMKANYNDKVKRPLCTRITNVILGIFCGTMISFHFDGDSLTWFNGLVAITASMLAVSILDTLYLVAPTIAKELISAKLNKWIK